MDNKSSLDGAAAIDVGRNQVGPWIQGNPQMSWDSDINYEPDDRIPSNLLEAIQAAVDGDAVKLEYVALGRKRRSRPGGKPGASFLKFGNYKPGRHEDAEEICSHIVGAALASMLVDGDLASGKFQATIVVRDAEVEGGKKDRDRLTFEVPDRQSPHTPPSHAPATACAGCAAYRSVTKVLERRIDETAEEAAKWREMFMEERKGRDSLAGQVADLGKDFAKVGHDSLGATRTLLTDAVQAAKPNMELTQGALGLLNTGVELTNAALEHKRAMIEQSSEVEKAKGKAALAKQGMKMAHKLISRYIDKRAGGNEPDDVEASAKTGEKKPTTIDALHKLRDTLFEVATDDDWALIRKVVGDKFTDRIQATKTGAIDLVHLRETLKTIEELSMRQMSSLFEGLSEKTSDTVMALMKILDKIEDEKAEDEDEDEQ